MGILGDLFKWPDQKVLTEKISDIVNLQKASGDELLAEFDSAKHLENYLKKNKVVNSSLILQKYKGAESIRDAHSKKYSLQTAVSQPIISTSAHIKHWIVRGDSLDPKNKM